MSCTLSRFFAFLRCLQTLRNLLCMTSPGILSLLFLAPHAHGEQAASTETLPEQQVWGANQQRSNHSATLLGDGTVLVVGGIRESSNCTPSAEEAAIYNPQSKVWRAVQPPNFSRNSHTATLLSDGRVLLIGGFSTPESSEIYNPSNNTWTLTAPMLMPRRTGHAATLLPDGRILITGGDTSEYGRYRILDKVEIYNPQNNSWTAAPPMNAPRMWHTATLLNDGTVMIVGGEVPKNEATTELPIYGQKQPEDDVEQAAIFVPVAEIYNPALNTWQPAGSPNQPRKSHTATLLKDGSVLVFGGTSSMDHDSSAEIFDPVQKSWRIAGPAKNNRFGHTATLLDSGETMMVGGIFDAPGYCLGIMFDHIDVFNPLTQTWRSATSREDFGRSGHTATKLNNGAILLIGGDGPAPFLTVIPDPQALKQTGFTPLQAE